MKLIIFTPAVKISAIGRMTSLVTRALVAAGHEVTVVRAESAGLLSKETHDFHAALLPWNRQKKIAELASQADAVIYQIGNSFEMHQGCLEWMFRLPGVVCLHDFYLGHLFYQWAQTHREMANETIRAWYGKEVQAQFFSHSNGEDFLENTRDAAPMTEWICSQARGVITHSSWAINRVLRSCPGPVHVVPLAYDAPQHLMTSGTVDHEGFRILTIGHVNPNKRINSVVRAIGKSALLRESAIYSVVGKIQPETEAELTALAKRCGVRLVLSGEVDDTTLAQAVTQSDVISCLRWPSLEAASASAIEAMLYGKPIIVTDTGFYSEIPDSCAIKIDPSSEITNIQTALEALLTNRALGARLGDEAHKWANDTFRPEKYAQRLVEVAILARPIGPVVSALNYISDQMSRWGASNSLFQLDCTTIPLQSLCDRIVPDTLIPNPTD
jgi:glycosyltransferase involved in cell wall biosynthesis